MKQSAPLSVKLGARKSRLSQAQVEELLLLMGDKNLIFEIVLLDTTGDVDKQTPLSLVDQTDFFTKQIDEALLNGEIRVAVHSAKDLPDPLRDGLQIVALTKGEDPRDVIVFRDGQTLSALKQGALIGTSSKRRQEAIKELRSDLVCKEIRGTIEERLALLDNLELDGVVMAKAALNRLKIQRNTCDLLGAAAPLQGRLAVVARTGDLEMEELFSYVHSKEDSLPWLIDR